MGGEARTWGRGAPAPGGWRAWGLGSTRVCVCVCLHVICGPCRGASSRLGPGGLVRGWPRGRKCAAGRLSVEEMRCRPGVWGAALPGQAAWGPGSVEDGKEGGLPG